jgi:hypothetical protein
MFGGCETVLSCIWCEWFDGMVKENLRMRIWMRFKTYGRQRFDWLMVAMRCLLKRIESLVKYI